MKWNEKVDWAFDDVWEKRKVYVVEGVSKLPQYAYAKRVLFIDKESLDHPVLATSTTAPASCGRSGSTTCSFAEEGLRRRQRHQVRGRDAASLPAIVMVDMQLEHATKASLPSQRFPGEQGWYFNQGEKAGVTDDWFTVAALVNAGH